MSTDTQITPTRVNTLGQYCCSIVVPVFNRTDQLRRLLALLKVQSTGPARFEVIVCDDGSTESCQSVIADFHRTLPNLRCLRQDQRGPAAARNLGILHAKSDVVVFLDSDVEPDRHLIARLTTALAANPDWQGAEARVLPADESTPLVSEAALTAGGRNYDTAGIAYRTDVLRLIGGMDENFLRPGCEGMELAVRVLEHGVIGFAKGAIVYRRHPRLSVADCWQARKNWRFVRILASRHGILSRPNMRTQFPRLRTVVAASLLQPLCRVRAAISLVATAPADCARGVFLSIVDLIGGVLMIPVILFEATPHRLSSVAPRDVNESRPLVARAS